MLQTLGKDVEMFSWLAGMDWAVLLRPVCKTLS